MPKRRKRRARKAKTNPTKKRAHRRKKRRHVAAATTHRRRRRSNPRRRRSHAAARTHHRRVHRSNPRRRRSAKRRHRRNPGVPVWAQAAIAAGIGVLGMAVASTGALAMTSALDPSLQTLTRNRYVVGGLVTLGGVALATKSPLYGAGLAAGGLIASGLGTKLTLLLQSFVTPRPTQPTVSAVYAQNLAGYEQINGYNQIGAYGQTVDAVYAQDMGAVFAQSMGEVALGLRPPWQSSSPFN